MINLQDHGLFHPTDIGYGLYTATSRFRNLLGATRLEEIRAGPQTHFHLQYLLIGGSIKCNYFSYIYIHYFGPYSLGRILSDSEGAEAALQCQYTLELPQARLSIRVIYQQVC